MAEILKFIHALVIFLSLIGLVISGNHTYWCVTTDDCATNICRSGLTEECWVFRCICKYETK
ncbi:putative Late nodulin [Medicago truncatula]|uniref:Nodule Cysteine-Rich (NCR) secreted peptide n=1 Tax=Medicago truncatula TaxID=3880 RepID=A0A072UIP6_MEDTR|nr:Nodule Cysteine-Rich (NCR) secreted peptide [Medicago truncatula]RHN59571.1 putative Late nodulin [Medicago truncatula]